MFARRFLLLAASCAAASAFAPSASFAPRAATHRATCAHRRSGLTMQLSPIKLTPRLFTELDTDSSGTVSAQELRAALGKLGGASEVDRIMSRADVNGDGEISYDEYNRLMNMDKFGDEQGGNLGVRQFQSIGLLKKDSVLGYTAMVGNKGFDPLTLAGEGSDETKLNNYREAGESLHLHVF